MLIVIDSSCTRCPPILANLQWTRKTTENRQQRDPSNMRDITILELRPSTGCKVDPVPLQRLCCHLCGFDGQVFVVREGLRHSSSAHLSSLSAFLHSSIHLSVHSSLHPSVHIAFVPHVDPSVMASVLPAVLYRHLSQASTVFKLAEIHNSERGHRGWRDLRVWRSFFFFHGRL